MVGAELDSSRGLVSITCEGRVSAQELQACYAELSGVLEQQRGGLKILTDLSQLEVMALDCLPMIKRIMDRFDAHGVHAIARVIPEPSKDIGFNILSLFHYRHPILISTCKTREEAFKALHEQDEAVTHAAPGSKRN